MAPVAHDEAAAREQVAHRIPARTEDRGVQHVVARLFRQRRVARVEYDEVGALPGRDRACRLRERLCAAARGGRPQRRAVPRRAYRVAEVALSLGVEPKTVRTLIAEGKLQAVAEEEGKLTQALHFGPWDAIISYGAVRNRPPEGNPEPIGRILVAQLEQNRFLVSGFHCRVDFHPSDQAPGKFRQYVRIEEGAYENGSFKFMRNLNGDQTDWGLNFGAEPVVLRVSLATY